MARTMDIEAIPTPRRHSGTRRYGVTDKHLRRDNARHAGTRKDRSGKRAWDLDGKRRLRSQPQPSNDVDYEQDLDIQHREVVDKKHPGINSWWVEEVLATLKSRVRANQYEYPRFPGLTLDEIFLLERLGCSLEQIKAEIDEKEVDQTTTQEPLADWERELLEVGTSTIIDHLSEPFWGRFDMDEDLSYFEDLMCPEHMKPRQVDPELPGAWMSSIHAQDEGGLLAEAFGGWGFKVTTRP